MLTINWILILLLGVFLDKISEKLFFHQEMIKKIFQKTHQSILIVQVLQAIAFSDTANLID